MNHIRGLCHRFIRAAIVSSLAVVAMPAIGQELADDMVGQNAQAWTIWNDVQHALERNDLTQGGALIERLVSENQSDLRLALMADRGSSIRLEQWAEQDDAPAMVKTIVQKMASGRRQRSLAEDGWHLAAIGRFQLADAHFKALDEANPDPVALLELARQNPNRHDILLKLINHAEVGPSVRRFLEILNQGEDILRRDPYEISININRLGGPPRMAYNAINRLKTSGEYAIPHLIRALQDAGQISLHPAIIQVLPKIGRAGLNPLCQALGIGDDVTKGILIRATAEIGYQQAVPYLAKIARNPSESGEVRAEAEKALASFGISPGSDLSILFLKLAELYYAGTDSLRADPRMDAANVWYLRDNTLRFIPVPTNIFNSVMAMRCCEESLLANPNGEESTALWLAANFRREAQLGLNVESAEADPLADKDSTRPEHYPRSIYFARAAGARYNHMVLSLALRDRDPGVALGAIAALGETAGEPSLVGAEDLKQPLVRMLSFPNRQVRTKAALTLGRALPKTSFSGAENVIPVLSEALLQSDRQAALIVDPDGDLRNKFQALLRAGGFECAIGPTLYQALQNGKDANLTSFDVILLGSDIEKPAVASAIGELRSNFQSAATPILIVAKEDDIGRARRVSRDATGVEMILSDVIDLGDPDQIARKLMGHYARAAQALGMTSLDRDLSLQLAIRSAGVLRDIAASHLDVYDFSRSVPSLIQALRSKSEALRMSAAHSLALADSTAAQEAVTESALDSIHSQAERIAAFAALAESARRNGNRLGDREVVSRLIEFTMGEQDLILRAAASKALGALDLPGNKASEIIRAQYKG